MCEWSREKCFQLIEEFEKHPSLWNPRDGLYYNKIKKKDIWSSIDEVIGCESGESKKKMDSILSSFRREKAKGKKFVGTGKGRHEIYVSKWFAFQRLSFLLDRDEPRKTMDSFEDEEVEETEDEENDEQQKNLQSKVEIQTPEILMSSPLKKIKKSEKNTEAESLNVEEGLGILKSAVYNNQIKLDECNVYGQHIANKIRNYSNLTRNIVQHHINNILFNADMGQYDKNVHLYTSITNSLFPNVASSHTINSVNNTLISNQETSSQNTSLGMKLDNNVILPNNKTQEQNPPHAVNDKNLPIDGHFLSNL